MTPCTHEGTHSGEGRYSAESGLLRYIVVCDECHAEVREVARLDYRPEPDPHGNDAFLAGAAG
jgi:hypothetical protein